VLLVQTDEMGAMLSLDVMDKMDRTD